MLSAPREAYGAGFAGKIPPGTAAGAGLKERIHFQLYEQAWRTERIEQNFMYMPIS
jgi:hypothetical protein